MAEQKRTLRDLPRRPGMRASMIIGTANYALARGVSMDHITAATGLRQDDLSEQDGWLPEAIMPALWRLIAQACPGEAVALEMAAGAPISHFGPLAHACRYAQDGRSSLQAFIRYRFTLSDNIFMELNEGPSESRLHVSHPMDERDGGLAAEMGLAVGVRLGREVIGVDEGLLGVELRHQPFGPYQAYAELFGVPVLFEQPHNALVFHTDMLASPTRTPDPELYRFIESHLRLARERIEAEPARDELSAVREAVAANAERSEYGAEALARRLGMSLRQLQRLTRAHDTTVRALLEEVREANARQLLSDRRLSIEEVSFLLGYSDDRAFRRAFKRWTGQTPAQLRRSHTMLSP